MRVKATTRQNVFSLRRFSLRRFWKRDSKANRVNRNSPSARQQKKHNASLRRRYLYSATSRDSVQQRFTPGVETRVTLNSFYWGVSLVQDGSQSVVIGDIGGTNARLSLWRIQGDQEYEICEEWYPTKDYKESGFTSVLHEFCKKKEVIESYPSSACFAIAGPVSNNQGTMTNLGWVIDGPTMEQEFNWKVDVINDFEALGYGIPFLEPSDIVVLNDVPISEGAPKAVLGPGTGLGEAQLMWEDSTCSYKVWPSEGAHADFAPRTEQQRELLDWVTKGFGYCEIEHVACGSGLERIYTFLKSKSQISVLDEMLMEAPEISDQAMLGTDPDAEEALDMMLSIVGAEAGHMGLRCLAHGGVYIAGGITPKVIERIKTGIVRDAFVHQEGHRFHSVLESFPLFAVLNEEVGLIGCLHRAVQLLSA